MIELLKGLLKLKPENRIGANKKFKDIYSLAGLPQILAKNLVLDKHFIHTKETKE